MGYSNTSKGRGIKGSKYWIQTVIEDECLRNKLDSMIGEPLVWISPLAGSKNTYDEYELKDSYVCDQNFFHLVSVKKSICFQADSNC